MGRNDYARTMRETQLRKLHLSLGKIGLSPLSITPSRVDNAYWLHTVSDLRLFMRNRGLRITHAMRKRDYVECLELDDEQYNFRFMDLPAEIRNMVYRLLLAGLEKEVIPELCQVSKHVRAETFGLFHCLNFFYVMADLVRDDEGKITLGLSGLYHKTPEWLENLSEESAAAIQWIRFCVEDYAENFEYMPEISRGLDLWFCYIEGPDGVKSLSGFKLEPYKSGEDRIMAFAKSQLDPIMADFIARPAGSKLDPDDICRIANIFCGEHWSLNETEDRSWDSRVASERQSWRGVR
ncbi:hypothetical protein H2203_008380 [Taxawa tesnikishii (nom. ined.)]|nr:hypothetical protein H2203_008380 [Dothideales sp. JES 119]